MYLKKTFNKSERLKSRKDIETLLKFGKRKVFQPLKLFVLHKKSDTNSVKFLVLVPKKNIRSSVNRNKTKRVIREVWRLNKNELLVRAREKNIHLQVGFLYLENERPGFHDLSKIISGPMNYLFQYISKIE